MNKLKLQFPYYSHFIEHSNSTVMIIAIETAIPVSIYVTLFAKTFHICTCQDFKKYIQSEKASLTLVLAMFV